MDLIPGVVLFLGAIGTVALLGWDTFQNRRSINQDEIQASLGNRVTKPKQKRRGLFNRG